MSPGSLWDILDSPKLTDVLAEAGILDDFKAKADAHIATLPPGVQVELSMLQGLFAESMAAFPGKIRDAVDATIPAVIELVKKGSGPVSHDPSALA